MNEQARRVQWAFIKSEPRAKRLLMVAQLHSDWIRGLCERMLWPVDALVEMLLLVDGDEEEIDRQLARWKAQSNHLLPQTGGRRDYQQFLSVLHAQHQVRVANRHASEDEALQKRRAASDLHDRVGRITKDGHIANGIEEVTDD